MEFVMHSEDNDRTKEKIVETFLDRWITGYDYRKATPESFKGKDIPAHIANHPMFYASIIYMETLYKAVTHGDFDDIDQVVKDELISWESKGGQCIYLSTLLYMLLLYHELGTENNLSYVQGYYIHLLREEYRSLKVQILPPVHGGLHAWIVLDGSVMDISIRQEEDFFDFQGKPFILGKVPEGLNLYGYREVRKTPKSYARMIAKGSGMKVEDWVQNHVSASLRIATKLVQSRMN
ncbi:hypothetical protein P9G84_10195 [Brevibacillus centrosporus]|uniref:hypothetical protein n=1 Tax=Brevibacillus centrosporus TaxID=54910 RepID=UPI0011419E74|nr:hypothetical protein [Brevibacillus centrosporus]MEC2129338.1 hypothetical protein [Brevibacillus centrosporus]